MMLIREADGAWPVDGWTNFSGEIPLLGLRSWEGVFKGVEKKIGLDYEEVVLSESATWKGFPSNTFHFPDEVSVSIPEKVDFSEEVKITVYWRPVQEEIHQLSITYAPNRVLDGLRLGIYEQCK